ncbi:hypothetical protein O3P69_003434 [Scylla paramamosain]|uniref:Peptidase S1 domain-containing protein n=1 Tax=Scylla paramamosain TaxID=85552 RepID=A0AAW0UKG4_SCYPA
MEIDLSAVDPLSPTSGFLLQRIVATPSGDEVIIGEHDWTEAAETSTTKRLRISRAIRHPNYSSSTLNNDLALLQLAERIVFPSNNKVAPVCLPEPDNLYEDVDAIVTGWGTLSSGGSQPKKLQEVTVPTMTNDQCKATGYAASEISDNMICAGVSEGGKDSCQGDSGGPMVTLAESGKMKQIGVVSWGYGCASARFPGVYTRVGILQLEPLSGWHWLKAALSYTFEEFNAS